MDSNRIDEMLEKYSEYVEQVKIRLSKSRFDHTLGVVKEAVKLAEIYDEDVENAFIAALFHDYSKYISHDEAVEKSKIYGIELDGILLRQPKLLHGHMAAEEIKEKLGIEDEHILDAIRYHTFGREHMRTLDKIIYIADAVEYGRDYEGVNAIRGILEENLDKAVLACVESTIIRVVECGSYLHINSVLMRNRLMFELNLKL